MAPGAAPGWYPDPRGGDGLRYWTGESWHQEQAATDPQSAWARPGSYAPSYLSSHPEPDTPGMWEPQAHPTTSVPGWRRAATWVALSLGVIAGFGAGFAVADSREAGQKTPAAASAPAASATAEPAPSREPFVETEEPAPITPSPRLRVPEDREAALLDGLGLRASDVTSPVEVRLIVGGDEVLGRTTLDLCAASYPSESRRTARRQLAAVRRGTFIMSTEAVLYDAPAALEQAFSELERAAPTCDAKPGIDADWPVVEGVQRLAYDVPHTAPDGTVEVSPAVYLRRGRTFLGLYFRNPGVTESPVAGLNTVPKVVEMFSKRLAAMPPGGPGTVA